MKSSQVLPALQFSLTLPNYLSYFKELYKLSQQKNRGKKKTVAKNLNFSKTTIKVAK